MVGLAKRPTRTPSSSPKTASSPTSSSTATTGTIPRAAGPARCSTPYQKAVSSTMSNHGVPGYQVMFVLRTRSSAPPRPDREKMVRRRIAKTNLSDHILTQDAIRFDDAGEQRQRHSGLLQVQGVQAGGGGHPRASWRPSRWFPVPKWKG